LATEERDEFRLRVQPRQEDFYQVLKSSVRHESDDADLRVLDLNCDIPLNVSLQIKGLQRKLPFGDSWHIISFGIGGHLFHHPAIFF
jgi:hypothetical protein